MHVFTKYARYMYGNKNVDEFASEQVYITLIPDLYLTSKK